jgi:hypothetical protein
MENINNCDIIEVNQKIVKMELATNQQPMKKLNRPELLTGTTYKIKSPVCEYSLYLTINDINDNGKIRPFEIFINSRNMEHYQWVVALTRIISMLFRTEENYADIISELKLTFDPKGGYFQKGGKYIPSLVAEIGDVIEQHLNKNGLVNKVVNKEVKMGFCNKCLQQAVIIKDGCKTCTNCGDSKCE